MKVDMSAIVNCWTQIHYFTNLLKAQENLSVRPHKLLSLILSYPGFELYFTLPLCAPHFAFFSWAISFFNASFHKSNSLIRSRKSVTTWSVLAISSSRDLFVLVSSRSWLVRSSIDGALGEDILLNKQRVNGEKSICWKKLRTDRKLRYEAVK